MPTPTWTQRRGRVATYFDDTALDAWARLTSDAPVSRVRRTVRQGRAEMGATLMGWLPERLDGWRVLDAGCGAGPLSIEAARRGADVLGVDAAPKIVDVARRRAAKSLSAVDNARLDLRAGDMLDPALGRFDAVICMDVLIHYKAADVVAALKGVAERVSRRIVFTVAPRTPALAAMHAVGRLFPRKDRAPAIEPVVIASLTRRVEQALPDWRVGRTRRISRGFYTSCAVELVREEIDPR